MEAVFGRRSPEIVPVDVRGMFTPPPRPANDHIPGVSKKVARVLVFSTEAPPLIRPGTPADAKDLGLV